MFLRWGNPNAHVVVYAFSAGHFKVGIEFDCYVAMCFLDLVCLYIHLVDCRCILVMVCTSSTFWPNSVTIAFAVASMCMSNYSIW